MCHKADSMQADSFPSVRGMSTWETVPGTTTQSHSMIMFLWIVDETVTLSELLQEALWTLHQSHHKLSLKIQPANTVSKHFPPFFWRKVSTSLTFVPRHPKATPDKSLPSSTEGLTGASPCVCKHLGDTEDALGKKRVEGRDHSKEGQGTDKP